jgi:ATP-dependent Clp protease ATP-binding subunit ClpA
LIFSPYGKRLIELAFENARALDNHFIDAEHLMLGYLSLADAQKVMVGELGLDEGRLRQLLIDNLAPKPKGAPLAAKQASSTIGFQQLYDRVAHFAHPRDASELWTGLRVAAEQHDPAAVLIYALSIASQEGSSAEEVIRRVELRLGELGGNA